MSDTTDTPRSGNRTDDRCEHCRLPAQPNDEAAWRPSLRALVLIAPLLCMALLIPFLLAGTVSKANGERLARSDAQSVAMHVEILATDSEDGQYPKEVTSRAGQVVVDGAPFRIRSRETGEFEVVRLHDGNAITDYRVDGKNFRLCVVNEHGAWSLHGTARDPVRTSGRDGQCPV